MHKDINEYLASLMYSMLISMVLHLVLACADEQLRWTDKLYVLEQAVAEEKFKLCSAAYQSLCDKLAVN